MIAEKIEAIKLEIEERQDSIVSVKQHIAELKKNLRKLEKIEEQVKSICG